MKEMGQFFKGFSPVAEPVLCISGHLCKGRFVTLWNEYRVVSKPRLPSWFTGNRAFRISGECLYRPVRKCQRNKADEPGTEFFVRDAFEFGKEFFVIAGVVPAARTSRIPRGVHPGRPTQRVHFESRVVGKGRPARALADLDRLLHGIPLEGVPVLNGFGAAGKIIEREDGHRQTGRDPSDLLDLLFIARGKDDFHKRGATLSQKTGICKTAGMRCQPKIEMSGF